MSIPDDHSYHESFAFKIEAALHNGDINHGTGFAVLHSDRYWIVTCRHLIEIEDFEFTGRHDSFYIRLLAPAGEHMMLPGRTVVTPRVNGIIADAVAISVEKEDLVGAPFFPGDAILPMENYSRKETFSISGNGQSINFPFDKHYYVQGYPNISSDMPPTWIEGAYSRGMLKVHPWMICYTPKASAGFSGGPVLSFDLEGSALCGIHTHGYSAEFCNKNFEMTLGMSGAVPIKPLLQAIEKATGTGEFIVDISI